MRIRLTFIFLFLIATTGIASAQVNVSINNIAKIHMVDGASYLGAFFRNDYDLILRNGQWESYQVREQYQRMNPRVRDPKKMIEHRDSIEHRFIKTIPQDSINLLLQAISKIKPRLNPVDLHLSIPKLTHQIDTAYLKGMDAKRVRLFNSFFDTPAKLYHLLDTIQHDFWTDDYPYSVMEIVKKQGDTVKVITTAQTQYMMPWRVNDVPTYDLNINKFFINATGVIHHRIAGERINYSIYDHVDYLYARDAFERLRWQELEPENFKYIQQHFNIVKAVNYNNDSSQYFFSPKKLNKHIIIAGILKINKKNQLKALTQFAEDTLASFLKTHAFMIDSCIAKPGCTITFINSNGQALHGYYSWNNQKAEDYLKKLNRQQMWWFEIDAGERIKDYWTKLPDGNFALTSYIDDYAVGILPKYIKKDGVKMAKFVFMIFSPDGKLIYDGSGIK
ncbi:hypothetical protein SAMN05428975_1638 [Mucilaginibacter sp. OK268]|uniref:hypothetical protein n=1 Tax=Mucilaginibacter sp. OK268 TaxID=1881048 RepID=UPI00088BEAF5|nr:hypothetical protein [Mucilaginibacter sp. OK268]SDP52768.1 hypothetical protein SAMN05428975_1638 [Mucilaginibacter sp. OK268]